MAREINLVPDIKDEMIKTLKLRNFIFFVCIVVAIASVGVTAVFGSIMGGQQLAIDGKKNTIDTMSKKLTSFTDLSDYLTIKDQLSDLSSIADNKKLLSRTFNILSALLPHGADTITISQLSIDLSKDQPTFTFDAQANAGSAPYIDYNVLDSFKKSMAYMRYDYGRYVDKNGDEIPAYCMIESDDDGTFRDSERGFYAYWLITGENCNPNAPEEEEAEDDDYYYDDATEADQTTEEEGGEEEEEAEPTLEELSETLGYEVEEYEGQKVVRIWRTPQFDDWYKQQEVAGQPYMDLDGNISNVAHFNSSCTTYSGVEEYDGTTEEKNYTVKWTETNDECLLIPDGANGIRIVESSNGRTSDEDLVLRFSAVISIAPEAFQFNKYHTLAIPPSGRRNVTDSYVQIQAMFGERARDCDKDDTACRNNTTNQSGSQSNTSGGN